MSRHERFDQRQPTIVRLLLWGDVAIDRVDPQLRSVPNKRRQKVDAQKMKRIFRGVPPVNGTDKGACSVDVSTKRADCQPKDRLRVCPDVAVDNESLCKLAERVWIELITRD